MKTIYYLIMGAVCSFLFKLHLINADTYKKYKKLYYSKKMAIFSAIHNFFLKNKVKQYFNLKTKSKKLVVYTCLTGGYDALYIHDFLNPECDYICFTDDEEMIAKKYVGQWKIEPLRFSELDNAKNNRWHKMHPHILFPDYKNSLYIDSNINFKTGKIFEYIRSVPNRSFIAVPRHSRIDCIYAEAESVVKIGLDTEERVRPLIEKYHEENFPEHFGMGENNVIFRRHNNEKCIKLMEDWWEIFNQYSRRDQLSLFYLIWKEKANYTFFSPYSFKKDHKNFRIYKHKG